MIVFGSAGFLWGLLLLGVPVAIHLAQLRQGQPWLFPSLRFLVASGPPRQHRRRLSDWWLLLLRCLVLATVVLILAEPRWVAPAVGTEDRAAVVYLFDSSASMAWAGRPEAVKAALRSDLERPERRGAALGRLVFDREARGAVLPGSLATRELIDTLDLFPPRPVGISAAEAVQQSLLLLPEAGGTLVVVTDGQAGQWTPSGLPELPLGVALEWLLVGDFSPNAAVVFAEVIPLADRRGRQVLVRLSGHREALVGGRVVLIAPDGRELAGASILQESRESSATGVAGLGDAETLVTVTLPLPDAVPPWAEVTFSSAAGVSDGLAADNARLVWLDEVPPVPVEIWLPELDDGAKRAEVEFLARALAVEPRGGGTRFAVSLGAGTDGTSERSGSGGALGSASVWHLAGALDEAPTEVWSLLRERLAAGGAAVVTPGRNPARLFRLLRENGLLAARWQGRALRPAAQEPFLVGGLPSGSPLGQIFTGDAARGLYLTALRGYERVILEDVSAASGFRSWLATESGDPLLVEVPVGSGRLVVSTFGWETGSSDLPLRAAFLPLVRALFAELYPTPTAFQHREAGTLAPVPGAGRDGSAGVVSQRVWERSVIDPQSGPVWLFQVPEAESVSRATPLSQLRQVSAGGAIPTSGVGPENPGVSGSQAALTAGQRAGLSLEGWLVALAVLWVLGEAWASRPKEAQVA